MPCDNLPAAGAPEICTAGGGGLLLPLFGEWEQGWPTALRTVLYLLGLFWCFMGVAIIADVFMGAIETVTSKRTLVYDKELNKHRTKTIWHPTVANLTLMALGSSAPEILLNVIGIFPTFQSSDLGPSTIVGSAAFNLLCITAVCVISIPPGEYRKIKDLGVFSCTAFFSVFAYVWLLVILMVTSPDVVEVWEGVLTFMFFWVLVVLAFLADTGKLPGTAKEPASDIVHPENTKQELADMEINVRRKYGSTINLTPDQVTALMQYEFFSPESRAKHRINATRSLVGGRKLFSAETPFEKGAKLSKQLMSATELSDVKTTGSDKPEVSFKALNYTVLESVGEVEISVRVLGVPTDNFTVKYKTKDGTATAGADYKHVSGELQFGPDKTDDTVKVAIVKTEGHEPTEEFYLDLEEPGKDDGFVLGNCNRVTIVVVDEDLPGKLAFAQEQIEVTPSEQETIIPVTVTRKTGSSGKVTCAFATQGDSATPGRDFEEISGTLEFESGQTSTTFELKVHPKSLFENSEVFRVVIKDPTGGVTFDDTTDGGGDQCILTILLLSDKAKQGTVEGLSQAMKINWDAVAVGNENYKGQFISAVYCCGSAEAQKEATPLEWAMHVVSLPWKLLFATVPPTEYAGGWVCFCCALLMIGFVTVIIGDMAELLGCCLGIPSGVTAITLVALGTSLPDTFASKTAAQMDPYADNSIGNITGSNSVNVFLGLGLPWMIAAIYWQFVATCAPGDSWYLTYPEQSLAYTDGIFVVKAGALSTSVIAFSICACFCIATLVLRRKFLGGELGGEKTTAYATAAFFVSLWIVYLVISIVMV